MTTIDTTKVDVKKLRSLYKDSPAARSVLDHFASRERNWSSTTVDRIQANLDDADISRADIIGVFKELEACGCGSFKSGRKGWLSRFEWDVQMVSVGQAAAGEAVQVEKVSEEEKAADEAATSTLKHVFRLRQDMPGSFDLPVNLTAAEANRLADFLKTLPFGA